GAYVAVTQPSTTVLTRNWARQTPMTLSTGLAFGPGPERGSAAAEVGATVGGAGSVRVGGTAGSVPIVVGSAEPLARACGGGGGCVRDGAAKAADAAITAIPAASTDIRAARRRRARAYTAVRSVGMVARTDRPISRSAALTPLWSSTRRPYRA